VRGFFFGSLGMTMTEVIDDSDSGLARLLTPSGPRCGLECCAFNQACIEYRLLMNGGVGGKENHRSRARDGYTHLTYAMYQALK
jgi:hypothetical protein